MKTPAKYPRGAIAFTLVEVLVAEAIFLILLVLVVQLIFGVVTTAGTEKKRMDALGDARQSLDRLSLDWASRVRRSDGTGSLTTSGSGTTMSFTTQGNIIGYFTKQAGNDQLSFLSQVQSYTGSRRLSWLSYQIGTITQVIQGSQSSSTSALERGIYPYNWTGSSTLAFPAAVPIFAANNYEPLANTVFRIEFCFLQQVPAGSTGVSPFTVDAANTLGSTNLAGVVVAVAALDQQSRQLLTQTQLSSLANALPRVTVDGLNPQAVWSTNMASGAFATAAASAGIPKTVANSVRIYQRILYTKE
jgi:type II secretory pathway pseudopilin PulG